MPVADGFEEVEAMSILDVVRRGGAKLTVASIMDGDTLNLKG